MCTDWMTANDRNRLILKSLATQCEQYTIKASDTIAGQTTHIDLQSLSEIEMKLVAFMVPLS